MKPCTAVTSLCMFDYSSAWYPVKSPIVQLVNPNSPTFKMLTSREVSELVFNPVQLIRRQTYRKVKDI